MLTLVRALSAADAATFKRSIMGTSRLKMYTSPTGTDGRTVSMPTVDSFKGTDGYTYKFTDKNYWYSYENPYGTKRINPYAITQIKAVTGSDPLKFPLADSKTPLG